MEHIPKPILLIRFPNNSTNMERLSHFYEMVTDKCSDYHVLAVMENSVDEMKFEIFNSNNAHEAELENIKTEIKESLKTI